MAMLIPASAQEVAFVGFAFSGDNASVAQRFPHTHAIRQSLEGSDKKLSRLALERVYAAPTRVLQYAPIDQQANPNQTLLSVLLFTGESVSTEQFGGYFKTFVNLRAEALIFDFKIKTIVRSYPISVTVFDAGEGRPTPAALEALVRNLVLREDAAGLLTQYARHMATATLPTAATLTFQVRPATLGPEALAVLPASLRESPALAGKVFSDAFGAVLASKLGLSLLPTELGDAMGSMSFRLDNGDAYNFKIPESDYAFNLNINRFVKVKASETPVGASWAYGVYANLSLHEPLGNKDYFRTDIKNGEIKFVPGGQLTVDDFPSYEAALRGLFIKFASVLANPADMKWIGTAAAEKEIGKQLDATRTLIKESK